MPSILPRLVLLAFFLVACPHPAPCAPTAVERKVQALVASQRGRMRAGVAIIAVERGENVLIDGHAMAPLASVFKLPLLIDLATRLQDGKKLTLDQRLVVRDEDKCLGSGQLRTRAAGSRVKVSEAIELMETISDNTATDILFNHIGLESVNRLMRGLGFRETDIYLTNRAAWLITLGMGSAFRGLSARAIARKWQRMSVDERRRAAVQVTAENRKTSLAAIQQAENASRSRPYADDMLVAGTVDNQASPFDLAQLLMMLQRGQLLDAKWTRYCLDVLSRQRFNTRIPRYLPRGTRTFHKTGSIEGVVNDAGIVEVGPTNHVVVVVLVHNVARGAEAAADELIARIARAAYDGYKN